MDFQISYFCRWKKQENVFEGHVADVAVHLLPIAAFTGHCVIKSAIVVPITGATVLMFLFATDEPDCVNELLLLMGKHSINIWLVHMFFLNLFSGFGFIARHPEMILGLILAVCIGILSVIEWINRPVVSVLNWKTTMEGG